MSFLKSYPSRRSYYELICSLPHLEMFYDVKHPPLSRFHLNKRLQKLDKQDADMIALVEKTLQWHHLPLDASDGAILKQSEEAILALARWPDAALIIKNRLIRRTITKALRLRHLQMEKPEMAAGTPWGDDSITSHLCKYWDEPDFHLQHRYPWIKTLRHLIEENNPLGVERALLTINWKSLNSLKERHYHYFDAEAVLIYVLQWDIVDRWTHYNADVGERRFNTMIYDGLANIALPWDVDTKTPVLPDGTLVTPLQTTREAPKTFVTR